MFLIRLEKWLCMDKDEQNSFWRCTLNIKYGEEMSGLHIGILCNAYACKTNIECWHKEIERERESFTFNRMSSSVTFA